MFTSEFRCNGYTKHTDNNVSVGGLALDKACFVFMFKPNQVSAIFKTPVDDNGFGMFHSPEICSGNADDDEQNQSIAFSFFKFGDQTYVASKVDMLKHRLYSGFRVCVDPQPYARPVAVWIRNARASVTVDASDSAALAAIRNMNEHATNVMRDKAQCTQCDTQVHFQLWYEPRRTSAKYCVSCAGAMTEPGCEACGSTGYPVTAASDSDSDVDGEQCTQDGRCVRTEKPSLVRVCVGRNPARYGSSDESIEALVARKNAVRKQVRGYLLSNTNNVDDNDDSTFDCVDCDAAINDKQGSMYYTAARAETRNKNQWDDQDEDQ